MTRHVAIRRMVAVLACTLAVSVAACDGTSVRFPGDPRCVIRGIDVSRHQGVIDWPAVFDGGTRFVWIKATEGGDYLDPAFRRNWLLARAAGVRRGAYHFVYWCRKAEDQASWFIANVPADPDALPPVLDVEWNPASRTCPQKIDPDEALGMMKTILAAMEKTYGRKPLIYVPRDFYDDVVSGDLADYPLWVRNIGEAPEAGYGGRSWTIWQRMDDGTVNGIAAPVDVDCFDGTEKTWRRWVDGAP